MLHLNLNNQQIIIMSEENKDLGDNAEDGKEDFAEGAKKTANEFSDGLNNAIGGGENKKILAGILAIILGAFGVHKFILGYTKEGVIMAVVTVALMIFTCGTLGWVVGVVGLIEGIIYLTKSDEEFYNIYQVGQKPWF